MFSTEDNETSMMPMKARKILLNVEKTLREKKSVQWDSSYESLQISLTYYRYKDSHIFINECLRRILEIMLDQRRPGPSEMETIKTVLQLSVALSIKVMQTILQTLQVEETPETPSIFDLYTIVSILGVLFDRTRQFYKEYHTPTSGAYGTDWNYMATTSARYTRQDVLREFTKADGFQLLQQVLSGNLHKQQTQQRSLSSIASSDSIASLPAVVSTPRKDPPSSYCIAPIPIDGAMLWSYFSYIVHSIYDCPDLILTREAFTQLFHTILDLIIILPSEEFRKISTESIHDLFSQLKHLFLEARQSLSHPTEAFQKWLALEYRFLTSSSLPLRIFGYEQLDLFLCCARLDYPSPSYIDVLGAGNPLVNGRYHLQPLSKKDSKLSKPPEYLHETVTKQYKIVVQQFQLKSGAYNWFITQVFHDSKKETDFYQNGTKINEPIPPMFDWTHCSSKTTDYLPEPIVLAAAADRRGGETVENCLDYIFAQWIHDNHLLSDIFCGNIHREVVCRSTNLLSFLATLNYLQTDDIEILWKACLRVVKEQPLLFNEVLMILSQMIYLSPPLMVEYLLTRAKVTLATMNEQSIDIYNFGKELGKQLTAFKPDILRYLTSNAMIAPKLLDFLWALVCHPCSIESPLPTELCELLILSAKSCQVHRKTLILQSLAEIQVSSTKEEYMLPPLSSSSSKRPFLAIPSSPSLRSTTHLYERKADRFIYALLLVLTSIDDLDEICQLEKDSGIIELLLLELQMFCKRTKAIPKLPSDLLFRSFLSNRLSLLRTLFSKTKIEVTKHHVEAIWKAVDYTEDESYREQSFVFFSETAKSYEEGSAFMIRNYIFTALCEKIHYDRMTELEYSCFYTYFLSENHEKLQRTSKEDIFPPSLVVQSLELTGIETLWKICLNAPTIIAEKAKTVLLAIYDGYEKLSETDIHQYLEMVFTRLQALQSEFDTTRLTERVENSIRLLQGICQICTPSTQLPHGQRSTKDLFSLTITARSDHEKEKTSSEEKTFLCHPKETFLTLKERLSQAYHHPASKIRIIETTLKNYNEEKTLEELGITQDSKLRAILISYTMAGSQPQTSAQTTHLHPRPCPAELMILNTTYFDLLFYFVDHMNDLATLQLISSFLDALPTNCSLRETIQTHHSTELMTEIFHTDPCRKGVYILQIMDALLHPTEPCEEREIWARTFANNGGIQHVYKYFTIAASIQTLDSSVEYSSAMVAEMALRVLSYYLFSEALPSPIQYDTFFCQVAQLLATYYVPIPEETSLHCNTINCITRIMTALRNTLPFVQQWEQAITALNLRTIIFPFLVDVSSKTIREEYASFLRELCATTSEALKVVLTLLYEGIEHVLFTCETIQEYYELFSTLVRLPTAKGWSIHISIIDLLMKKMYDSGVRKLIKRRRFSSTPRTVAETSPLRNYSTVLTLCLQLLYDILEGDLQCFQHICTKVCTFLIERCLFALPNATLNRRALCTTTESRQLAYHILSLLASDSACLNASMKAIKQLLQDQDDPQPSHDTPTSLETETVSKLGLVNQGCSCYMNSFLQQLYMEPYIRDLIMSTALPQQHIFQLNHERLTPEQLIGYRIGVEFQNGRTFHGTIVNYKPETSEHIIEYDDANQQIPWILGDSKGREKGPYYLLPPERKGDDAALEVLSQLQRMYYHLSESEMRYFDPREFIAACKCLNLEYNVYQQNDAAEFCDKLLDRLEIAYKTLGFPQIFNEVIGGKMIFQKVPIGCGHSYEKEESFIRLELPIRNKQSIEESLSEFIQGETMDGENQVECENCHIKKPAIRRTCFGHLPNLLILHLKRFDLDFTTFETVKLNSRCEFPMLLNMKPYTKEGIRELEEHEELLVNGSGETKTMTDQTSTLSVQTPPYIETMQEEIQKKEVEEEYLYQLKGILVHSGIAQGGHYYSFICDRDTEQWYKFDDETVSPFDPSTIEQECFGGMQPVSQNWRNTNSSTSEVETFRNALMLFYSKVSTNTATTSKTAAIENNPYAIEVRRENMKLLESAYLLDPQLASYFIELLEHYLAEETVASMPALVYQVCFHYYCETLLRGHDYTAQHKVMSLILQMLPFQVEMAACFLQLCAENRSASWYAYFACHKAIDLKQWHGFFEVVKCCIETLSTAHSAQNIEVLCETVIQSSLDCFTACLSHSKPLEFSTDHFWQLLMLFAEWNMARSMMLRQGFLIHFLQSFHHTVRNDEETILRPLIPLIGRFLDFPSVYQSLGSEAQLDTPALIRAGLTDLFQQFADENGSMSKQQLVFYLLTCSMLRNLFITRLLPIKSTHQFEHQIDHLALQILEKYGEALTPPPASPLRRLVTLTSTPSTPPSTESKLLKLEGFLQFHYANESSLHLYNIEKQPSMEETLQKHLYCFGYDTATYRREVRFATPSPSEAVQATIPTLRNFLLDDLLFYTAIGIRQTEYLQLILLISPTIDELKLVLRTILSFLSRLQDDTKVDVHSIIYAAVFFLNHCANEYTAELVEYTLFNEAIGLLSLFKQGHQQYGQRYYYIMAVTMLYCLVLPARQLLDRKLSEWEYSYGWLYCNSLKPELRGELLHIDRLPIILLVLLLLGVIHNIPYERAIPYLYIQRAEIESLNGVYQLQRRRRTEEIQIQSNKRKLRKTTYEMEKMEEDGETEEEAEYTGIYEKEGVSLRPFTIEDRYSVKYGWAIYLKETNSKEVMQYYIYTNGTTYAPPMKEWHTAEGNHPSHLIILPMYKETMVLEDITSDLESDIEEDEEDEEEEEDDEIMHSPRSYPQEEEE